MKFSRHIFFMLGIATMTSFGYVDDTVAALDCSNSPGTGYYCYYASYKPACPSGCYCPGTNKGAVANLSGGCEHPTNRCGDKSSSCKSALEGKGVYYCPYDFPNSNGAISTKDDCYTIATDTGKNVYYKNLWDKLKPGFYAPGGVTPGRNNIKTCPTGYICKGQSDSALRYHYSVYDQGIEQCPDGTTPNDDQTDCVKAKKNCPAGTYLPKQSRECEDCTNGYVCLGGSYEVDYPTDQGKLLPKDACTVEYGFADDVSFVANGLRDGCDECAPGTKANLEHTECVETFITIPAGYYLPANSVNEHSCNNPKKFCPGGDFWKSYVDQGIYDCPGNGSSSGSGYASCVLTLGKEELQYGLSGEAGSVSKCWLRTDPDDFRYCVLGIRGIQTLPTLNPEDIILKYDIVYQNNIRPVSKNPSDLGLDVGNRLIPVTTTFEYNPMGGASPSQQPSKTKGNSI